MIPHIRLRPCTGVDGDIFNPLRTFTYLQQCDTGEWPVVSTLRPDKLCSIYGLDPEDYTSHITFSNPIADPAPWYTSVKPESADFLGFYIEQVTGLNNALVARSPQPSLIYGAGGSLGPARTTHREFGVSVLLFAKSDRGMAYGMHYLNEQLHNELCSSACDTCDAEVRLSCPDGANKDQGRWLLYDVATIDGPTYSSVFTGHEAFLTRANFTLASAYPYLFECAQLAAGGGSFPNPYTTCLSTDNPLQDVRTFSFSVTEPYAFGSTSPILSITAGPNGMQGVRLVARPDRYGTCGTDQYDSQYCDDTDTTIIVTGSGQNAYQPGLPSQLAQIDSPNPDERCLKLFIKYIPPNSTFIYDAVRKRVYLDLGQGNTVEAMSLIDTGDSGTGFQWLDVTCGTMCFSVMVPAMCVDNKSSVVLETVHKEL